MKRTLSNIGFYFLWTYNEFLNLFRKQKLVLIRIDVSQKVLEMILQDAKASGHTIDEVVQKILKKYIDDNQDAVIKIREAKQ